MKIAWIGTGVMGSAMLMHLVKAEHEVHAYNRSYEKVEKLVSCGVAVHQTIKDCVKDCDMVFTMVGYPKDVEEVYTSKDGIFAHAKKHAILIDMTTSSPKLAQALSIKAKALAYQMMDAPVSGGDSGAKAGTLSIMCGGDPETFDQCKAILSLMGTPLYMGEAGSGQHTNACNQIAVAGAVAAMSEAIVYAKENHLNVEAMLQAIAGGAAGSWQINNTAPRVLKNDFAPGFYIKHFIKDMHIVQEEMGKQHLDMLDTVCHMYEELAKKGEENAGTQALIHYYEKHE